MYNIYMLFYIAIIPYLIIVYYIFKIIFKVLAILEKSDIT